MIFNKSDIYILDKKSWGDKPLLTHLINNENYSKVTIFVRRMITRWVDLPEDKKQKLNIIEVDSLDCLLS